MTENEKRSLSQLKSILGHYTIQFCGPENLDIQEYQAFFKQRIQYISFDKKHFSNVGNYSFLLTTPLFYRKFKMFEYILIYQLDAYVFKDELISWCKKGFDYIGPPWINSSWQNKLIEKHRALPIRLLLNDVGNGGFSLRKVKSHFYLAWLFLPLAAIWPRKWNEDSFWVNVVGRLWPTYKIASTEEALLFGFEENPEYCFNLTNQILPFGCHAWEKYNPQFWEKHIK
ncbi:DUF5672 family protein [Jiulongibacter sp. NS-SX5]|uniref:DUF5672 family protein n=1 Tax=Jiulongibacter sp. NS-SX5 TaxID=3463854 RepID=UPI004058E075